MKRREKNSYVSLFPFRHERDLHSVIHFSARIDSQREQHRKGTVAAHIVGGT